MNELKVYHCNEWHNEYTEFYLKSEADKVIAELKSKLDIYKRGFAEDDKINAYLYAELRHHKYKRCSAMAKMLEHICPRTIRKAKWKGKWHMHWLVLAEKFKEAK